MKTIFICFLSCLLIDGIDGFRPCWMTHGDFSLASPPSTTGPLSLFSTNNDEDIVDDSFFPPKQDDDLSSFNPFQPVGQSNSFEAGRGGNRGSISLRQTRMQEINRQLLDAAESKQNADDLLEDILKSNRDFLIEPLEDTNAVLDPDSIYTADMDRDSRYQAYRQSMEKRISSAKNGTVRKVLNALSNFILSQE